MAYRHGLTFDGKGWYFTYDLKQRTVQGRIGGEAFAAITVDDAEQLHPKLCSLTAQEALKEARSLHASGPFFLAD